MKKSNKEKREKLIEEMIKTKTTLDTISELRKIPMGDDELHVIPFGTKVYRVVTPDCGSCNQYCSGSMSSNYKPYCLVGDMNPVYVKERFCPKNKVVEGIYMGHDDYELGTKTFFTEKEALEHKNL